MGDSERSNSEKIGEVLTMYVPPTIHPAGMLLKSGTFSLMFLSTASGPLSYLGAFQLVRENTGDQGTSAAFLYAEGLHIPAHWI
ncbi:hypothetical protein Agabi119p4_7753 [Agaricus bisporus var. burnettii]|uniref:Uncharacterized protein n=1 Tax=Agaricus bisporus var. burnettii TaxID=192524 RepID=A0A8H7C8U0_AGABI|nr:hypothetical protein Agabi119p4_7753 [Agaricus bisporus var. burnettii]